MKKTILGIGIIILMLVIFVSGCTDSDDSKDEESDNGGTTGNTYTMTAKEFNDDMIMDKDWNTYETMDYISLEGGDTLIIQDTIAEILYNPVTDSTTVTFEWIEGEVTASLNLQFEGNITGSYQVGYEVKVTVKIKHVTFTFEVGEMLIDYDIEIFEEQWTTQEDYVYSGGRSPLPSTSIEKIV